MRPARRCVTPPCLLGVLALSCVTPPAAHQVTSDEPPRAADARDYNVAPSARLLDRAQIPIPLADTLRRHQLSSLVGKAYVYLPEKGGCEAPALTGSYNILAEDRTCTVSGSNSAPTPVYTSKIDGRLVADLAAYTGVASVGQQSLLDVRIEEAGHALLDTERPRCFRPQAMRLPRGRKLCRAVVVTGVVHYVTTVRALDRVDAAASVGLSVLRVGAQAYRAREQLSVRHTLVATVLDVTAAMGGKRRMAKGEESRRLYERASDDAEREAPADRARAAAPAAAEETITLDEADLAEALRSRSAEPMPPRYEDALRSAVLGAR